VSSTTHSSAHPPSVGGCAGGHPAYLTRLTQVPELNEAERADLQAVTDRFAFRSNDYYQRLIDWSDPQDPIRRIIMPDASELIDWGTLDASQEATFMVAPGVEHKYPSTALLLVTDVCGGYCRFCFRKRLFMPDNDEVARDVSEGLAYIEAHQEISNVLLTGGDPLMLSTRRLTEILTRLAAIDHVDIIRIGSKMPAFNPARISDDAAWLDLVRQITATKGLYLMAHFNHPRELTPEAIQSLRVMRSAGATTVNQTPIIHGVNDDPAVLRRLFNQLARAGTPPYYVFQCRPTLGNLPYSVPVEQAYRIFASAQATCSGLAKRARFVMSHATGKLEVIGLTLEHVYLRYHEAVAEADLNRVVVLGSNPAAGWLDDYDEIRAPLSDGSVALAAHNTAAPVAP
jgi:lysine 2,3-aminomutase